jgi:hypothetical protein
MFKSFFSVVFFLVIAVVSIGQSSFSGSLQLNTDFYMLDSNIQAPKDITINYTNNKSSSDAWFTLKFANNDYGLDAGIRFDLYNNSILFIPLQPYSGYGIGNWFISKTFTKMKITAGNFYEQFGSGIAFRAYEERALGIDNAMIGVKVQMDPTENLRIKTFVGLQKYQFTYSPNVVKGINIEYNAKVNDSFECTPGIAVVNRTLTSEQHDVIKSTIDGYKDQYKFTTPFNTYVFSLYNTMRIGNFSWFVEGAYKTQEAIFYPDNYSGRYENKAGNIIYTSLSYSKPGFGVSAQLKRTENYSFHATSIAETNVNRINSSRLAFIPSTVKQHSLRLPSRYVAASQEIEEFAGALDLTIAIKDKYVLNFNGSMINSLGNNFQAKGDSMGLYYEAYADIEFKKSKNKKMKGMAGIQYQRYNQKFYQGAEWHNKVDVISLFGEFTYKFTKKNSLKTELQYQYVPKDFGQWLYGLVEYNISPRWSFSVSDMWNIVPNEDNANTVNHTSKHYYSFYASFTHKVHRFSAAYVKQVGGIVCTGGVCRPEPAFSGVRCSMSTNF